MISITEDQIGTTIVLMPNHSASWRHVKQVLIGLGGLTIAIAIVWASQGAWVVLPFAGLEVILLSYFVYRVNRNVYQQEVMVITAESLALAKGYREPLNRWQFALEKLQVDIERPRHSLSTETVVLTDGQQTVQIGKLLSLNDMQQLLQWLQHSGLPLRWSGETTTVAKDFFE